MVDTKYSAIKEKVKELPKAPGVYLFKNALGKIIYVGKALRLRDRVMSYFQKPGSADRGLKVFLPDEITDIEVRQTDSEIEALVLEAFLIKTLKPRYNVVMKDDKQYFFVGFTKEQFPKIVLTHQMKTEDYTLKAIFVGPFVNGRALKATLRALRRIFPYCTCKVMHASKKTCLNYHIGIDPGYCCSKDPTTRMQRVDYKWNLEHIKDILRGKKARVISGLQRQMEEAASLQQFERAAVLRNQLEGIEFVLAHKAVLKGQHTQVLPSVLESKPSILNGISRIEGYDISNIQGQFAVGSMVVIARDRKGIFTLQKQDYRRFKIKTVKGANDPAMMKEVVRRRLAHQEWPLPDVMLIDGGVTQRNAVLEALEGFPGKRKPSIWSLAKQQEELYTTTGTVLLAQLSRHDARVLALLRDEAHRFAIGYYRRLHNKELTSL